jgi:hypothetical protein
LLVAVSRVLALAALAACYRPGDRCAVAGACDDAPSIDVPADSRVVGPPPCTLPDNFTSDVPLTATGDWFGATLGADREAIMRADFADVNGTPRSSIFRTVDDITGGSTLYTPLIAGSATETYQSPRLSYNGHELLTRVDRGGTVAIARAFRAPLSPSWSVLLDLDLRDGGAPFVVPAGADVGVPTQTTPRRMILVYGAAGFDEFEENAAAGTWDLHLHHATPNYEESFFGQAHLTADGLRLVYVHQITSSINAIYVVERPDYESMFLPASRRLATASSASRPYLVPDCTTLFYDDGTNVHMTSY